jgi:hypothetical protein
MACLGRNYSPKLIKYKMVLLDEVYILIHFNIILKHNRISSTKLKNQRVLSLRRVTVLRELSVARFNILWGCKDL